MLVLNAAARHAKAVAITSLANIDLDQGHLKASSRHVSGSRVQCRACLFAAIQIALHGKLRRHANSVPSLGTRLPGPQPVSCVFEYRASDGLDRIELSTVANRFM